MPILEVTPTQIATLATPEDPLLLQGGQRLQHLQVAYETYGQINAAKDNAILLCHALTGDAHAAGFHHEDFASSGEKAGWWDGMIGSGCPLDTDKFFIISSNVLGGCKGTTGPASVNLETQAPYGLSFPVFTVADMVTVQARLVSALGIERLHSVVGGSLGGFQALQWAIAYPKRVASVVCIASSAKVSAQAVAFNAVGRHAIINDPNWQNGNYYNTGLYPDSGLKTARMMAHITYLSHHALERKFGRRLQKGLEASLAFDFEQEFAVESYLAYQGQQFIKRFDANSYLYLTKAMDYFDLEVEHGSLIQAFANVEAKTLVVSYSSDWLFPTGDSLAIARALRQCGKEVSFVELASQAGHDAFLVELDPLARLLKPFFCQS